MISKEKKIEIAIAILLAIICGFPIFMHLTTPAIRLFDESRLALSAIETAENGNWLVVNYLGSPDMWSTKPPLMILLQAFCIKLFGINEFSIRFPAALSALLICAVVYLFFKYYLKQTWMGFISVLLLITSSAFVHEHLFRTGDYDSLLTLLTLSFLLFFFVYIENIHSQSNQKYLLYFFIALTLSVLCKGIQGLLFLPSVLIYTLIQKKALVILKQKYFYIGMILFLTVGIGYYFLREFFNPGYLTAVWNNEMGGRFNEVIETHKGAFSYYFLYLINEDFKEWYLLVPCGILIGLLNTNTKIRNLTFFISIASLQYLFAISFAQTKLWWYEAPLLPLLAMLAALFISWLFESLKKSTLLQLNLVLPVSAFIFLFLLFINPYTISIKKVFLNEEDPWAVPFYEIPNYLRQAMNKDINLDGNKIIYSDWPSSILFYKEMLDEKNQVVNIEGISTINVGDKLIVQARENYLVIDSLFNIKNIDEYKNVKHIEILSRK